MLGHQNMYNNLKWAAVEGSMEIKRLQQLTAPLTSVQLITTDLEAFKIFLQI